MFLSTVPVKNLGDTAVADPQLPADDTGPDPGCRHLDDLEPDVVGQRPPVDEHAAQLVDPPLACNIYMHCEKNSPKTQ